LAFEGPKIFQNNFSTYTVIGMLPFYNNCTASN
jgi:hypothetical protein